MQESIRSRFETADGVRAECLDRARFCASLTKPWILPPDGWTESEKLPETFSSLAARGITNLEGRLLLAIFPPPGQPWFKLKPSGTMKFDPSIEPEMIQEFQKGLHLQELMILAQLEKVNLESGKNGRRTGFRSRMRLALSQLLITGDVLMHISDDFDIRVFRRDNYVTKRNPAGDVMYHITREQIDPLTLPEKYLVAAEMSQDELSSQRCDDRLTDLYTMVEWNPLNKHWVITQEMNGFVVNELTEKISPYMSVTYALPPAADYGRGLVEENLGDVRSMNELTERILDFAAIASKQLFALDYNSQVRPQDLASPTGSVIQARVQGGQISDIGMLRADKLTDFNVVSSTRENIRRDLAVTMLMEAETTPTGERVTAYQVQRVAMELEGALGGLYAPIADSMQMPLVERVRHVLVRKGLLVDLPDEAVEINAVTGVQALANESDQAKVMQLLQTIAQLGPETMARLDTGVLLDLLMRQSGIYEPGLVKSQEQIEEEQAQMRQQEFEMMASQQAVQTGGKVVEQQMAADAAPPEQMNV
jgi:hypothetical protein